jgi:hypothetical protein
LKRRNRRKNEREETEETEMGKRENCGTWRSHLDAVLAAVLADPNYFRSKAAS